MSRDFTYVDNVVSANLLAAQASTPSGITCNVACGSRYTLLDLLDAICEAAGRRVEPTFGPPRAGDIVHSQADISLAREALGYDVVVPFAEGHHEDRGLVPVDRRPAAQLIGSNAAPSTSATRSPVRRLRIAYVPAALRPGGAERQMLALAERLPKDQFEVDFLVLSGPGDYDARARAAGARVREIGAASSPADALRSRDRASHPQDRHLRTRRAIGALRRHRRLAVPVGRDHRLRRSAGSPPGGHLRPPEPGPARVLRSCRTVRRRTGHPHDRRAVVANSAAAAAYAIAHERLDPAKVRIIRNGVELIAPMYADASGGQPTRTRHGALTSSSSDASRTISR